MSLFAIQTLKGMLKPSAAGGGGGSNPPVATIDINSTINNIVVQWTQDSAPSANHIYKSINGGSYALYATVSGGTLQYSDTGSIGANALWNYKVKGDGDFSNEVGAGRHYFYPSSANTDLSTLIIHFTEFYVDDNTVIETLDLSHLKRVSGSFSMGSSGILTELTASALHTINGDFDIAISSVLTTLNLPSLVTITGDFKADICDILTNVSFPNYIITNGSTLRFNGDSLSAASVNHILSRVVASGVTTCTVYLDTPNNALPTGQGITDYSSSVAAGNTIFLNL